MNTARLESASAMTVQQTTAESANGMASNVSPTTTAP